MIFAISYCSLPQDGQNFASASIFSPQCLQNLVARMPSATALAVVVTASLRSVSKNAKRDQPQGLSLNKDFPLSGNIPRLAAYKRARRALRRECEPFALRATRSRTALVHQQKQKRDNRKGYLSFVGGACLTKVEPIIFTKDHSYGRTDAEIALNRKLGIADGTDVLHDGKTKTGSANALGMGFIHRNDN